MEDKYKVYIKGVAGRGKEVIKMLKGLGGKEYSISGSNEWGIYYIKHDLVISFVAMNTEQAKIIMDNYHEIKLPEKWHDGDILINLKTKDFAVYREDDSFRKETFRDAIYVRNDGIFKSNFPHRKEYFSLALDKETQQFYELLHKHHKDWDAKNKCLVDWKWKPKLNETYWHICSDGRLISNTFDNDKFDISLYNSGNCFRTHKEAEVMVEKIKKLLKA